MKHKLDVVTFGEAMLLLVADKPGPIESADLFHKRTAGAETNVAIGLARLGLKVGWASRLGDDSIGRYLRGRMSGSSSTWRTRGLLPLSSATARCMDATRRFSSMGLSHQMNYPQ